MNYSKCPVELKCWKVWCMKVLMMELIQKSQVSSSIWTCPDNSFSRNILWLLCIFVCFMFLVYLMFLLCFPCIVIKKANLKIKPLRHTFSHSALKASKKSMVYRYKNWSKAQPFNSNWLSLSFTCNSTSCFLSNALREYCVRWMLSKNIQNKETTCYADGVLFSWIIFSAGINMENIEKHQLDRIIRSLVISKNSVAEVLQKHRNQEIQNSYPHLKNFYCANYSSKLFDFLLSWAMLSGIGFNISKSFFCFLFLQEFNCKEIKLYFVGCFKIHFEI